MNNLSYWQLKRKAVEVTENIELLEFKLGNRQDDLYAMGKNNSKKADLKDQIANIKDELSYLESELEDIDCELSQFASDGHEYTESELEAMDNEDAAEECQKLLLIRAYKLTDLTVSVDCSDWWTRVHGLDAKGQPIVEGEATHAE